jgi:hypothetical protein
VIAFRVAHRPEDRVQAAQAACSRRLKSAFSGAARRASAFADARDNPLVGAGRPLAEGLWRPNSFGTQADRRPEAFAPIEIGLLGRCAPGVGLRRRERQSFGRRRPTVGRRPLEAEFIRRAGRLFTPIEIGLLGRCAPGVGLRRRKRQSFGRRRPTVGRRPTQAEFIRCPRPIVGRRPSRRLKSAFSGAARRASAFADARDNPLVGAGRPLAEGLWRPNSFGTQADHRPKAPLGRIPSTDHPACRTRSRAASSTARMML